MKSLSSLLIPAIVILLSSSCKKEEVSNVIPEIEFDEFILYKDASGKDTAIDFIFTIKDQDGDIGFTDGEYDNSCGADNNNLYLNYFERSGSTYRQKKFWGQVIEVLPDCDTLIYFDSINVAFNQRMQYIEPEGVNKSIEAKVTYRIEYVAGLYLLSSSGRFEFYIRDRANHFSNVEISDDLLLNL